MDTRTCGSLRTDQPAPWVSSLGKTALNLSHTANYCWDNPQELWRMEDIKLCKPELAMPARLGQKSLWNFWNYQNFGTTQPIMVVSTDATGCVFAKGEYYQHE